LDCARAPKHIYSRKIDKTSLDKLYTYLQSKNIYEQFDTAPTADPDKNYEILEKIISDSIDHIIPMKRVKYNKYKYKKIILDYKWNPKID
jgi:hypothetical protein